MLDFITWWVSVEAFGFIALPIAFLLFSRLPDRGYAFTKPLGMMLVSYLFWLVGLTGLIPTNRWTLILVLALVALGSLYLARRHGRELLSYLYRERWAIVAIEVLFLGAFVVWSIARSYDPAINHTEQPMDFAFLNANIIADSFPPQDPWLSGNFISYYYFGYLISGNLSKLTGVPPSISYNLALSLLFALTAIGAFGLVSNLIRLYRGRRGGGLAVPMAFGFLGSLFVVGIGNLEGLLESVRSLGLGWSGFWNWLGIKGVSGNVDGAALFPSDDWWWRTSRVIDTLEDGRSLDFTITETPSFSFVLGDLHPHVMSLPFVLLALGLGLQVLRSQEAFGIKWIKSNPLPFLLMGVSLGALGFLNSWNFPTSVAIFLSLTLLANYRVWGRWDLERFKDWAIFAGMLGGISLVLFLPFYLYLDTQLNGAFPVEDVNTRYIHYVLILGLFLFFSLSFLVLKTWGLWRRANLLRKDTGVAGLLALAPFALWTFSILIVNLFRGEIGDGLAEVGGRFVRLLPLHLIIFVILFAILHTLRRSKSPESPARTSVLFGLILLLFGFLVTLGPELFRIIDVFDNRMNTVFKFYYQAWIILAVASAFVAYYLVARWRWKGTLGKVAGSSWIGVAVVLVVGSLLFPFGALRNKTGGFDSDPTLNGLTFVYNRSDGEIKALELLVSDGGDESVVVEAIGVDDRGIAGGDYNIDYGRVSGRTGLPTILGWAGHEYQWRGTRNSFQERTRDVEAIYTSSDIERTKELLDKYNVSYIYIGDVERSRYEIEDTSKFDAFMEKILDEGDVTIYKVREARDDGIAVQQ